MSDRETVLARVRAALSGARASVPLPGPLAPSAAPEAKLLAGFSREARAAGACVHGGPVEETLRRLQATHPASAVVRAVWLVAETGTVVLVHGRGDDRTAAVRAEIAVVLADRAPVLPDLAAFYGAWAARLGAGPEAAVLVTGPSRTADIEKTLVLGAHGPRELHVLLGERLPP